MQSLARLPRPEAVIGKVFHTVQKDLQSDPGLKASKGSSQAKMQALPEGEVRVWVARDIEAARVGKLLRIMVRGAHHGEKELAGGNALTMKFDIPNGLSVHPLQGRTVAERFLDS